MACTKLSPYILQELVDITEIINSPIQNVQRIKYTCFDVSKSMIAFGATSGGIYVFNRCPCEFVQLIPSKDGPITRLAISEDEKHVGYANGKGIVAVTDCDQSFSGAYSSRLSKDHYGNEVTAMIWYRNMLFNGDDIGKISVLQLQNFIAKSMFQSASQIIMSLDSRICQLDSRGSMLLVSTMTKCYLCNITQEQYRQIGQKLRDGEFGACFASKEKPTSNGVLEDNEKDFFEVKRYNAVDDDSRFVVSEELNNTLVFCARPSSRLWEATIDGTVRRTHQFKQVLAKQPLRVVTIESYNNENITINSSGETTDGQSINFSKIFCINDVIFSYSKNALYFLNLQDVDFTMWFDTYKDILECKIYNNMLYIWLANGALVNVGLIKVDKFLLKCYLDEKFTLCSELCTLYENYLLNENVSPKLYILSGLREKVQNNELLNNIENVLKRFDDLKEAEIKTRSGIHVVDNTYNTQLLIDETIDSKHSEDKAFGAIAPDTLQALKGLSVTVSDKLNSSKQLIKEKWGDFEDKIKNLNNDRQEVYQIKENNPKWISRDDYTSEDVTVIENDIIFKESSQVAIDVDNNKLKNDKICKMLLHYFRLSIGSTESEVSNLISIIETHTCDITEIYELMLLLNQYCICIGALEESKCVPNNIFLAYLNVSSRKHEYLDRIISDDLLYNFFVNSCISVNMKTQKFNNIGCECGYPLPYIQTSHMPVFSELIDEFIERQWSNQTKEQCYEICKRMPYLWRKILYLRRNEDLLNVLRVLLQMLDENLLHSFLPQFTLDTWDRAIQLYSKLYANVCLNCNKKFDHISVKDMLSWDHLGSLIIKSVGGRNAIKVMKKHGNLIETGALTTKFYHSCILVSLFEKFDGTLAFPLVNTLYKAYNNEESIMEICKLLQSLDKGEVKNTALPLTVAATSPSWGLKAVYDNIVVSETNKSNILNEILLTMTSLDIVDCALCGLPLHNQVLINDGGLWVFKCGHTFHGACLELNKIKLCPSCSK